MEADAYSTPLVRLTELEAQFNGPIPTALLAVAHLGTPEAVAFFQAGAATEFYRRMVHSQVEIIRNRRLDGSFYPALLKDLRHYREHYRAHRRLARELRRLLAGVKSHPIGASSASPAARQARNDHDVAGGR